MTDTTETRFRITSWNEQPVVQLGGDSKIATASITQDYEGEIQGQASLVYAMYYLDDKTAKFSGFENLDCEYQGRSGRFVIAHDGEYSQDKARSRWQVVPDSGTDELAGISGSGSFEAGHGGEAVVTLNLKLG